MPTLRVTDRPCVRGRSIRLVESVLLVVVGYDIGAAGGASRRVTAVSDNREQPGPLIAAAKAGEVSPRAQIRLLDDILRVVFVAHQMPGERVGVVDEWNDALFEAIEKAVTHDL